MVITPPGWVEFNLRWGLAGGLLLQLPTALEDRGTFPIKSTQIRCATAMVTLYIILFQCALLHVQSTNTKTEFPGGSRRTPRTPASRCLSACSTTSAGGSTASSRSRPGCSSYSPTMQCSTTPTGRRFPSTRHTGKAGDKKTFRRCIVQGSAERWSMRLTLRRILSLRL